jgi:hypothetical protein
MAVEELEVDGVAAEEPEAPDPVTPGLAEPGVVVVAGAGVGEPAGELVVCANAGGPRFRNLRRGIREPAERKKFPQDTNP